VPFDAELWHDLSNKQGQAYGATHPCLLDRRFAVPVLMPCLGASKNTKEVPNMNNSITLIGHVGQNPKTLSFRTSDKKLVKFSLAVKEFSSADEDSKTLWVDVEAWNALASRVLATITKGREVAVQGRLAMTSYSKSETGKAIEVAKPVVKLTGFHLCGKKPATKIASESEDTAA